MARTCLALALLLLVAVAAHAADRDLVACYTFDEDGGIIAKDTSGHGLNGKIVGGAAGVASPRGRALHFDGQDDYVDLGTPAALALTGDLTLEAWLRPETLDQRNRLIIGDTASLSVQRNYSIRFDREGLFFEYGNNVDAVQVVSTRVPKLNEWSHLAMLCEFPHYYLYLNGELVQSGNIGFACSPTKSGRPWVIGGWWAGWFQGDIDEVRVYNRALTEREVMEHAGLAPQPRMALSPVVAYSRQRIIGDVAFKGALPVGATATLAVRESGKTLRQLPLKLAETRPGSERWSANLDLPTKLLKGGKVELVATVVGPRQEALGQGSAALDWPKTPPVWFGSKAGVSTKPTAPFQPYQYDHDVCGRKYINGPSTYFAQIETLKQELLASPMRLVMSADGKPQPCDRLRTLHRPGLTGKMDNVEQTPGLTIAVTGNVEYDGFARFDCTVSPRAAKTLDGLALEIPFRPDVAKYVYSWPKITSHALAADVALPFQPILWLGDEEKGLSWMCESDQNWSLADPEKAVQVVRGEKETVLRITLVDKPVKLPKAGFRYTFALQATPLRPAGPTVWDQHYGTCTWYGEDLDLVNKQIDGKPALEVYAAKGMKTMLVGRWWKVFAYPAPIGYEQQFRALVKACHAVGIKVVPYVGGFLLSELAPEAALFKQEMTKRPLADYALRMPGLDPQTGFITCQNSSWADFMVDGIARLMDEYDVDGVYLDSTTIPWLCSNELHGCGTVKPNGERAGTYPVFAVRRHLQRVYNVVKARKPEGIVDMHVYDCMNPGALAYCTSYWNGEQLGNTPFKLDGLPLERFRTEFMGTNWGVPADMLFYMLHDYRKCTGLALLHDVPVRPETLDGLDLASQVWALHDRYPYKQAQWWPYWKNRAVAQATPEGAMISLYAHPQEGVLAFVMNLSKTDADVRVELDAAKLGLGAALTATDAISGAAVAVPGHTLTLPLKSQEWAAVWVKTAR